MNKNSRLFRSCSFGWPQERLSRMDVRTRGMERQEYLEFHAARGVSFGTSAPARRAFLEWLTQNVVWQLSASAGDLLALIAYEIVAKLTETAVTIRDTAKAINEVSTRLHKSDFIFIYNIHKSGILSFTKKKKLVIHNSGFQLVRRFVCSLQLQEELQEVGHGRRYNPDFASNSSLFRGKFREDPSPSGQLVDGPAIQPKDIYEALRRLQATREPPLFAHNKEMTDFLWLI